MKRFATSLALGVAILAMPLSPITPLTLKTPAAATGIYQLQLLMDIYAVLDRCTHLDAAHQAMRRDILHALKREGFTDAHIAMVVASGEAGQLDRAGCAALMRPLLAAYLDTPD